MPRPTSAFGGATTHHAEPKAAKPAPKLQEPPIRYRDDRCGGNPDCKSKDLHACHLTGHVYCRKHCSHRAA